MLTRVSRPNAGNLSICRCCNNRRWRSSAKLRVAPRRTGRWFVKIAVQDKTFFSNRGVASEIRHIAESRQTRRAMRSDAGRNCNQAWRWYPNGPRPTRAAGAGVLGQNSSRRETSESPSISQRDPGPMLPVYEKSQTKPAIELVAWTIQVECLFSRRNRQSVTSARCPGT